MERNIFDSRNITSRACLWLAIVTFVATNGSTASLFGDGDCDRRSSGDHRYGCSHRGKCEREGGDDDHGSCDDDDDDGGSTGPTKYYVRVTGSDYNNGTSPSRAFRTISKAHSVASAGSTIVVGAGTYSETTTISRDGYSTSRILYKADTTGVETGDAGTVKLTGGITLYSANYVTLRGFKFQMTGTNPFKWQGGVGTTLDQCEITGAQKGVEISNNASASIVNSYFHDLTVDGIVVLDSSMVNISNSEISYCTDDGIDADKGARMILADCYVHHNVGEGLELKNTSTSSSSSYGYGDDDDDDGGYHYDDDDDDGGGGSSSASTRVYIERCKISDNSENGVKLTTAKSTVRNSLVTGNAKTGINATSTSIVDIYQSTIAANSQSGVNSSSSTLQLKNSIVANNSQYGVVAAGTTTTSSYNLVFNNTSGNYSGTWTRSDDINSDPKFSGGPTPYMLLNGSPAIDRGYATSTRLASIDWTGFNLPTGSMDLFGTLRPISVRNDLGAYEGSAGGTIDYYVSTTGNDANDGRSRTTPYKTIGKAAAQVMPGDIIHIASGTYTESPIFNRPGSSTAAVKVMADATGGVVVSSPSANHWAVIVSNAHYTEFSGIRFTSSGVPNAAGSAAYGINVSGTSYVKFENCEFDHSVHGVYADDSSVYLKSCSIHDTYSYAVQGNNGGLSFESCTFNNNVNGPYSYRNSYFQLKSSTMTNNTGWAFTMAPATTTVSTYFGANTPTITGSTLTSDYGLYLASADNNTRITFDTSTITPKYTELLLYESTVNVTPTWRALWKTAKGKSNLETYYGTITVDGLTVEGYREGYGLLTHYGTVTVSNSSFRNNYVGAGFHQDDALTISNCNFENNKGTAGVGYGMQLWAKTSASISNSHIDGNGYGFWCNKVDDTNLTLSNTTIANNTLSGIFANDSDVSFTAATMGTRWKLSNNGTGITTEYGKVKFDGVTIRDNTNWGAVTYYGDVTVLNSEFISNGEGGFWSYNNATSTIRNSKFQTNGVWGLAVAVQAPGGQVGGNVEVTNCTISNNTTNGLYLAHVPDNKLSVVNSPISNHSNYGLYATECSLTFNATTVGTKWLLSNNGTSISTEFGTYTFDGITLTGGNNWGAVTYYSDVTVRNCDVTGNGNGFWSYKNLSFNAENSRFNNNHGWGLAVSTKSVPVTRNQNGTPATVNVGGAVSITGSQVSNNAYGLYAHQCSDSQLVMSNTAIESNSDQGVQCFDSELAFNATTVGSKWKLANNYNGIITMGGTYTFQDVTISGNRGWGAVTYYSNVTVSNSTFSNNQVGGFWSYKNASCNVNNSHFTGNGVWGAAVRSDGTSQSYNLATGWTEVPVTSATAFNSSFIENNTQHGLYLEYTNDANYTSANTVIRNNPSYGVYAHACDLNLNNQTIAKWNFANNGNNFVTMYGRVKFDNVTLSGANEWDVITYYGDVTAQNSTFSGGNSGGFWSYGNTKFVGDNCRFTGNGTWGLAVATNLEHQDYNVDTKVWSTVSSGVAEVKGCTISGNQNGMYAYKTSDSQLTVNNLKVESNTGHGLYAWESDLAFNAANFGSKWRISGNGYNITTNFGTILFDGIEVSDATQWGVLANWGNVTVKNSTFTRNAVGGFQAYANPMFKAENSNFNGNSGWGLSVYTDGTDGNGANVQGTVTLTGCKISNNSGNGLLVSDSKKERLTFQNLQIENNVGHGIYAQRSTMLVDATFANNVTLNRNGYGISMDQGELAFDNVTLNTNSLYWASVVSSGTVSANKLTIDGDGGGFYANLNDSFSLKDSKVNNTKGWGLFAYPKKTGTKTVQLDGVVMNRNAHGIQLVNADQGEFELKNTTVSNSSGNGLAFSNSTLTLADQQVNNWQSVGNRYGLVFSSCPNIVARDITVENSQDYGLVSSSSQVRLEKCHFTGHGGIYTYRDAHMEIVDSRFEGNSDGNWNWGLVNYGSDVNIVNSIFANFFNGIYAYAYDDTLSFKTTVLNSTITSTDTYGVYFDRAPGKVVNSIVTSRRGAMGLVVNEHAQVEHEHNLIFGYAKPFFGTNRADGEIFKNPRFRNLSEGDYQLAKGSPAINAGKSLPGVVDLDMAGHARGTFRAWEIGAYEFAAAGGSIKVKEWKEKK